MNVERSKKLEELLDKFLEGPRIESDDECYPKVQENHIGLLSEILRELVLIKYGTDMSGCAPIRGVVYNAADGYLIADYVPHEMKLGDVTTLIRSLSMSLDNASRLMPLWSDRRPIHKE